MNWNGGILNPSVYVKQLLVAVRTWSCSGSKFLIDQEQLGSSNVLKKLIKNEANNRQNQKSMLKI